MADYSFYAFGPTELGFNNLTTNGPLTVNGSGTLITIVDDDPVLDDQATNGGQTYDLSQQVLKFTFGGVPAGNVVQSVYKTPVFNQTTGQSGFDYNVRLYSGSNPASPGSQAGVNYHAFSIAVNSGDVLVYDASQASFVGQVSYSSLFGSSLSSVLSINSVIAAEGSTGGVNPFTFTVTRDNTNGSPTATYTITNISTDAVDFGAGFVSTGTVTFAANSLTATIIVPVAADRIAEGEESFRVTLSNGSAGVTFSNAVGIGTLVNDDNPARQVGGTNGNDLIYGLGGGAPSTLVGYEGDDRYVVQNINDVIIEYDGGGNDIVYTSISYTLNGGAAVENLSTQTNAGTESINLIGNSYAQNMVGNFGNNVINGNGGADTLIGLKGDDIYAVGDAAAIVREAVGEGYDTVFAQVSYTLNAGAEVETLSTASQRDTGAINLTGNEFAQQVVGNFGNNVLDGGLGADTLIGLAGADTFRFSTTLGNGNVDRIADFESGVDKIALLSSVFTGIATGTLSANAFVTGTAATTAEQRIVYNQTTGQLFYDADGSGSGAAVLFATVNPGTALQATDIQVIATVQP